MSLVLEELARRASGGQLGSSMERGWLPQPYPPATPRQVADAEAQLGFTLPALLRDIYLNVANGGFGPGYGIFSLANGTPLPNELQGQTLVENYISFRYRSHREPWDEKLLPICSWGCTYFSYLDCALPQAPVMGFDENSHGHGPRGCAFSLHAKSFEEWMRRWLDGEDLWKSIGLYGEPKFGYEEYADDDAPVRLSRRYSVAPDAVFEAWLMPDLARRWLFKARDAEVIRVEMDARVGGSYSICVNMADKEIEYCGTYEVIERAHQLVFSLQVRGVFNGTSRVSVEVTPAPDGSRLTLTHRGLPGRAVIGPWTYMLDELGRVLADRRSKAQPSA